MQPLQPSLCHQRRSPRDMPCARKRGRHSENPGLRQAYRPAHRSHRKKAFVSFPSRDTFLFHCHRRLQFSMPLLPKCRHCTDASDRKERYWETSCTPREVVDAAQRAGCRSIAYTYTEPTVFFEFAYETAKLAHEKGIRNVFVTNGYMTAEALEMIDPYLDAANVDLKAFTDKYYKELCGAGLEHVQATLKIDEIPWAFLSR